MGHQKKCKALRKRVFGKNKKQATIYANQTTEKYAIGVTLGKDGSQQPDKTATIIPKITKFTTGQKRMYRWLKKNGGLK
jgi:hypothetical protein